MPNHYTYRAEWSPEDDEYVGLIAEFPRLSWLAPTAAEAISGAEQLVDEVLADMAETGETPPEPLSERRYSGKLSVRTSPEQHRQLTIEAAEQGVSVNQWIVQKLSVRAQPGPQQAGALMAPGLPGRLWFDSSAFTNLYAACNRDLNERSKQVREDAEQIAEAMAETLKSHNLFIFTGPGGPIGVRGAMTCSARRDADIGAAVPLDDFDIMVD
ncbi:HicB family protein [Mycolicibacterium conceptionense]|uniref:HicB family protein n=1 Tax=Mycolicibacterium conceptionense TaxID=451644 RepID=A0A0U1DTK2_9MYCO|nr:HicB family protein [Mycolicibacterium conceptionense]